MLIINADDYGKDRATTDRILLCHEKCRVTSATAMMFMADTERSAELALSAGMDVGLHLNLSDPFTGNHHGPRLVESHGRVSNFLKRRRWALLIYNPALRNDFEYTFRSQWDRFTQLYGRPPSHIDGHRHRHLCPNAVLGGVIPRGTMLRRNFHFEPGEKGVLNRIYRGLLDRYVERRFVCTDYFFSIRPIDGQRIRRIVRLAETAHVEIMVHPELDTEMSYLMNDEYPRLLAGVPTGSYSTLRSMNEG